MSFSPTNNPLPLELVVQRVRNLLGDLRDGSGTLIADHAIRVALLVKKYSESCPDISAEFRLDMQRAALCHDLLEDTAFGESALKEMIGTNAAELVNELTLNFEGRTIREAVAPVANYSDGAFLIKLADILDNVSKSVFLASHNKKGFYQDFFLPLIEVYQEIIEQKLPYVELGQFACISLAEEITGQLCSLRKVVAVLDDSSSFD